MNNYKYYHPILYAALDIFATFVVVLLSFLSFYNYAEFGEHIVSIMVYAASISVVTVLLFFLFKIYRIITEETSVMEFVRICLVTIIVHLAGLIAISSIPALPSFADFFYTWVLSTVSLLFFLSFTRIAIRLYHLFKVNREKSKKVRTVVIGAGSTGKVVIDESRKNKDNHNFVVAVVDDDPNKIGGLFQNIPVKGPISDIKKIIEFSNAEEVIIAISKLSQERLHEILELLRDTNARVRRMPLISEMEGPNDKRIIDVDLDDLLYREPIKLDNHKVRNMLNGQTVLVTGAGGSIGSELVRQIYRTQPKTLILFDIYENSTYDIQMQLLRMKHKENIRGVELITLIGSTYNEYRIESVIKKYKPDYIYHAAAYKHVPLMEDSPMEAIRTNVIGTYNVAKFADKYKVKKMILVSTDKAVRPTNVMGATKRFAETIIQYFDEKSKNTNYAAVRFGNVLGSNGSVIPLFKKQIEDGGPVTITDKNIIRYFMTIPEAVSLILQCGLFAHDGEVFILDMGKPVKILDLAERLIRQAGLVPYVDIDIIETGLRPGEKLYEELLLDKKHQKKTANSRIFVEEKEATNKHLVQDVEEASQAFNMAKTSDVKKLLASLINTYQIDKH
jgi:FlaA1/EpsC-like NDP-sugar epimerase